MDLKEEDVFLTILGALLVTSDQSRSVSDLALSAKDMTKEVLSVTGKMSKSKDDDATR